MSKIILVGCGFLGSHIAEELGKFFFSQEIFNIQMVFIDFDKWEERNAANQHVDLETAKLGEYKSITCKKYFDRYSDRKDAVAITEKLTPENARQLLEGSDLVIDAVDNIPTRQLIAVFGKNAISGPVMHVGISRKGEGMINWSSDIFDTFPFPVETTAGREMVEQDIKEPPCEMYKYRTSGLSLVQAVAKCTAFYYGKDPWQALDGGVTKGLMTSWSTSTNRSSMLIDKPYLVNDDLPCKEFGEKNE